MVSLLLERTTFGQNEQIASEKEDVTLKWCQPYAVSALVNWMCGNLTLFLDANVEWRPSVADIRQPNKA